MQHMQYSYIHQKRDAAQNEYVYTKNIQNKNIVTPIQFTKQKNGWAGSLSIQIANETQQYNYEAGDLIQILATAGNTTTTIYTWYIDDIAEQYKSWFLLQISVVWLASDLKNKLVQVASSFVLSRNDTTSNIVSEIIDIYNTNSRYQITKNITAKPGTQNVEIANKNVFDAIQQLVELDEWRYRYIDNDGQIIYGQEWATTHLLSYAIDIDSIDIDNQADIVNKVYLDYNAWSKTYTDTASVDTYWLRETKISKTNEIGSVASADAFMVKYFAKNAQPQQIVTISVNSTYKNSNWGIETIQPGDEVVIAGLLKPLSWIVEKIKYTLDKVDIELNKTDTFISLLEKNGI